ncbi:MAG: hypothetical protein KJ771_03160 [Nanoarchaeota archaeon]|nr:hypothetical protein [Nanoarchaeota archaeon]
MIKLNLIFKIDLKKDIQNVLFYCNEGASSGVNYKKTILYLHPKLNIGNIKSSINYIKCYYISNSVKLKIDLERTEQLWLEYQEQFEKHLESIFPHQFNFMRNIIVNPSIINSNPIYFDENRFMYGIALNDKQKLLVIFHELIHFVYGSFLDEFDVNDNIKNVMLESFNLITLNNKFFSKILDPVKEMSYPLIRKNQEKLEELYSNSDDLFQFSNNLIQSKELLKI